MNSNRSIFSVTDKSVLHMLAATLAFSLMAILVKWLDRIPTEQIVFFRALVAFILCLIMLRRAGVSVWGRDKKWLVLRGVFGTVGLVSFFYSVKHLPLATSTAIQNLSPLFTVFFAGFILKETVRWQSWIFFFFALCGTLIVKGFDGSVETGPFVVALVGAIGAGLAYNCVARLKKSDHPLVIIFYFPLVTLPVVAPMTVKNWVTPSSLEWMLLLGVGVVVQVAQYFMTLSYSAAETSRVSIIYYLGIVLGALNGYLFFGERLSLIAALGITVILVSVLANTVITARNR